MIFEMIITSKRQHSSGMERFPSRGTPPTLVELFGYLGIRELIKQLVHEFNDLGSTAPSMTDRHGDRLGRSSLEAYLGGNHLLFFQHGHVLNQQAHHAFAISI